MKKIIAIIIMIVLCVGLVGCTNSRNEHEDVRNAEYLINLVRHAYNAGDDFGVFRVYSEINTRFPDSEEYKEARQIVDIVSERREEREESERIAREEREAEAAEDAQRARAERLRGIVRVTDVRVSRPNSAGGVDLWVDWTNMSDRPIAYFDFTAVLYNAVGHRVNCDIGRTTNFRGRATGPFNRGQGNPRGYHWRNAWWNNSGRSAILTEIRIEYMDGDRITISGDDLIHVQY
ncbi:MAG: hypothetical protein FWE04_00560 [Oscillospiraceae bacterium]|nr:hypothetical protein [Oscillospiraceae bacterium]